MSKVSKIGVITSYLLSLVAFAAVAVTGLALVIYFGMYQNRTADGTIEQAKMWMLIVAIVFIILTFWVAITVAKRVGTYSNRVLQKVFVRKKRRKRRR